MAAERISLFPHHNHLPDQTISFPQQRVIFWAIIIALGITQATLAINPVIGSFVSAFVLCGFVAAAEIRPHLRSLLIVCSILPLINLINLILPDFDQAQSIVIYYGVLLSLTLVYKLFFFKGFSFRHDKVRHNYRLLMSALIASVIIGAITYGLTAANYVGLTNIPIVILIIIALIFAATEELYFRGLVQQQAEKVLTPDQIVLLPAIIYALGTLYGSSFWTPIIAFVIGATLSVIYNYRPNLIITFITNATMKIVFILLIILQTN